MSAGPRPGVWATSAQLPPRLRPSRGFYELLLGPMSRGPRTPHPLRPAGPQAVPPLLPRAGTPRGRPRAGHRSRPLVKIRKTQPEPSGTRWIDGVFELFPKRRVPPLSGSLAPKLNPLLADCLLRLTQPLLPLPLHSPSALSPAVRKDSAPPCSPSFKPRRLPSVPFTCPRPPPPS